jgi:hypothetical protein
MVLSVWKEVLVPDRNLSATEKRTSSLGFCYNQALLTLLVVHSLSEWNFRKMGKRRKCVVVQIRKNNLSIYIKNMIFTQTYKRKISTFLYAGSFQVKS